MSHHLHRTLALQLFWVGPFAPHGLAALHSAETKLLSLIIPKQACISSVGACCVSQRYFPSFCGFLRKGSFGFVSNLTLTSYCLPACQMAFKAHLCRLHLAACASRLKSKHFTLSGIMAAWPICLSQCCNTSQRMSVHATSNPVSYPMPWTHSAISLQVIRPTAACMDSEARVKCYR